MRFIEYARRRREGFGPAASLKLSGNSTDGDTAVGLVIAGIMFLFAAYATVQYIEDYIDQRDLRVSATHIKRADKAEKLLLTALNGGAILIEGRKAFFFDKQKETPL